MVEVIPKQLKDVWDTWNIRGMIVLSLSLQIFLIFFSPLRKRTPNKFLILLLWSSYLLADFSANYAVALIAKNQGKDPKPNDPPQDKKLVALWAPFLLLHLGGPDTITAFSLEDNALWNRHFLWYGFQALSGVYVVVLSLPNVLGVIILFLFIAGTSKYLERTIALYLASSDKYRGSIMQAFNSASDYTEEQDNQDMEKILVSAKYMKEHRVELKPRNLMIPNRKLTHLEILQYGFFFFNNFKSLMVNNIFSLELRLESKAFFRATKLEHEEALRVIEAELDFIYEGLYTKAAILHSRVGLVFRFISLGSLLSASIIYHYRHNKIQEYHKADIVITYSLFLVGIALDVISLLVLVVSNWTTAIISTLKDDPDMKDSLKDEILSWILGLKRPRWALQTCSWGDQQEVLSTPFLLRRWTGSITMFNFLTYCMKADTERIHNPRGGACRLAWNIIYPFSKVFAIIQVLSHIADIFFRALHRYIIHHIIILPPGENQVTRFIVYIIKTFVEFCFRVPSYFAFLITWFINFIGINDMFHEIRLITSVHREPLPKNLWSFIFSELQDKSQILDSLATEKSSARRDWASSHAQVQIADHENLLRYITDVDYDHSLLIWHIATELCYQREAWERENADKPEYHSNRKISKILSDYMMYLFIMQPKLMSEVAGIGKIRFRDTLAEAERFFKKERIENSRNVKLASDVILSVDTSIDPRDVKGNHSKSVLFEASSLAEELQRVEKEYGQEKWKTLSKVWLEFLFHAASHCDATARMELLSKGGEFINFVWLLMAHLGLGE